MPQRYLNRKEKTLAVVLASMSETLVKTATEQRDHGYPARAKRLRTAATNLDGVLKDMVAPLDDAQIGIILAEAARSSVVCYTKSEAAARKDEPQQRVLIDDIYDLAQAVIEGACCGCAGDKPCQAKDILLKLGIPVFDDSAPAGVCPYKQERGRKR